MKKTRLALGIVICLSMLVMLIPFMTACGGDKSEQTLKIGITTPSTGPAAEKGVPLGLANRAAIDYINNELGGINGYKIEVIWRDNGYDASRVTDIVRMFMDEGCLLFSTSSSAMMTASMEIANRAGFPGIVAFSAPNLYRPPQYIYGQSPDYGDDFIAFMQYYLDEMWTGEGKPRVAIHALNNSTGHAAFDAARAYADEMGIEIIAQEQHTATTQSEMESLTRIRGLNPDVLYISSTPAPTALIIKNATDLGIHPGVTIASGHAGFTSELINIAGTRVSDGVYGVFPSVSWGDPVPGMAKLIEYAEKNHPAHVGNMDYITAWAQSLIMAKIVENALNEVGYDVLAKGGEEAWNAIIEHGIKKMNYDVEGLQGPVIYSEGDNRLSSSVRIFQIQSGAIAALTGWIEAPVVEYEKYDWFSK